MPTEVILNTSSVCQEALASLAGRSQPERKVLRRLQFDVTYRFWSPKQEHGRAGSSRRLGERRLPCDTPQYYF